MIWPILIGLAKDVALYIGGGAIGGAAVGAALGFFLGGVGAIPGAIAGASLGSAAGSAVLNWLGLASLAQDLAHAIPDATDNYARGFKAAWGPLPEYARGPFHHDSGSHGMDERSAIASGAFWIAQGHIVLISAILMAIIAYVTRGKRDKAALMAEIRNSRNLGPKVADWVAANEAKFPQQMAAMQAQRNRYATEAAPAKAASGEKAQTPSQLAGKSKEEIQTKAVQKQVDLQSHERSGGHLIEKHVGKTEAELRQRLADEARISGSSSFKKLSEAEKSVSNLLDARKSEIDTWLAGSDRRLVLEGTMPFETGTSVSRGASVADSVSSVRVILEREPSLTDGYRIVTGFPVKP
jgi:Bacterial CdiA-CT RNAse A domain